MKWTKYALLGALITLTGCAGGWGINSVSQDGLTVMGTREGWQAFGRMVHGSKEESSPYWGLQKEEETTNRMKYMIKLPNQEKGS